MSVRRRQDKAPDLIQPDSAVTGAKAMSSSRSGSIAAAASGSTSRPGSGIENPGRRGSKRLAGPRVSGSATFRRATACRNCASTVSSMSARSAGVYSTWARRSAASMSLSLIAGLSVTVSSFGYVS